MQAHFGNKLRPARSFSELDAVYGRRIYCQSAKWLRWMKREMRKKLRRTKRAQVREEE